MMAKDKPGLIRRVFGWLSALGRLVRSLFNILFLVVFVVMLIVLFGGTVKPLPERAFLRVAPSGQLVEQLTYTNPLAQIMQQRSAAPPETLLSDLVEAIDHAAGDPRITGLSLELDYFLGGGITKANELAAALNRFKAAKKSVIASGSNLTQEQYYLASFADEIHLNPMGAVALTGYGAYQPYFKDALDKLKVNFHVFKVGEFKDAVEPFTRNSMSQASRMQTSLWLTALWQSYRRNVEHNRGLTPQSIDQFISDMPDNLAQAQGDTAKLAMAHDLVDHISTRAELMTRLQKLAGTDPEDEHNYQNIDYREYLFHKHLREERRADTDKVGLIVARGAIHDGEQVEGDIGGQTLAKIIRKAGDDDEIKALVLRVDSPGGSAFASEVIRGEIARVQAAGKPVVVSMSSVAASGGYWIAANADQIWAAPTTLTGSIGVFGLVPTFEKSLDALGITTDGIGTSPLAGIYRLDRPMSAEAERIIQLNVEHIYRKFLQLVSQARELPVAELDAIAQGRVFTGTKAKSHGLVDNIGLLKDALDAAAGLAGLEQYDTKEVERDLNFQEQLARQLVYFTGLSPILRRDAASGDDGGLVQRALRWLEDTPLVRRNDPANIYLECLECRWY